MTMNANQTESTTESNLITEECQPLVIIKNCKMCQCYQYEEVGDSDFGAIYSDTQTCMENFDMDDNECTIKDFDRDIERKCCRLDFFKVADVDKEIGDLFNSTDEEVWLDTAYKKFKEKYC